METKKNIETALSYLSSAEHGDTKAQSKLCQLFFDSSHLAEAMPDDFWSKIKQIADEGKDYANFIMHCRYIIDPDLSDQAYYYARQAVKHDSIPLALLRLGVLFDTGVGAKYNPSLANYYYEKAAAMGCDEAYSYIQQGYETGTKDIVKDIENAFQDSEEISSEKMSFFEKQLERERSKKSYGIFSRLREYLPKFYPDYDEDKAISDILANRESVDADILFSLSTTDNNAEVDIELQERFLQQLFALITQDEDILDEIVDIDNDRFLDKGENEIIQYLPNLYTSYTTVCRNHGIKAIELSIREVMNSFPYMSPIQLATLRRQLFRCLLSIKDVDPAIEEKYLRTLDNDEELLNIAEKIIDIDLQAFLSLFIGFQIDLDSIEQSRLKLLNAYRKGDLQPLADRLNEFTHRLIVSDVEPDFPEFTPNNLPFIDLT